MYQLSSSLYTKKYVILVQHHQNPDSSLMGRNGSVEQTVPTTKPADKQVWITDTFNVVIWALQVAMRKWVVEKVQAHGAIQRIYSNVSFCLLIYDGLSLIWWMGFSFSVCVFVCMWVCMRVYGAKHSKADISLTQIELRPVGGICICGVCRWIAPSRLRWECDEKHISGATRAR